MYSQYKIYGYSILCAHSSIMYSYGLFDVITIARNRQGKPNEEICIFFSETGIGNPAAGSEEASKVV